MSIKVMTMVFDRYPVGGTERMLALALADHAADDGTRIWPSLSELARKTLQSRSTVQRQVRTMVQRGWLVPVRLGTGRHHTNEYRICPGWIEDGRLPEKGVNLPPVDPASDSRVIHRGVKVTPLGEKKGVTQNAKGVTQDVKGVIAVLPESSEPSRTITPLPPADAGGERASIRKPAKPDAASVSGFDAAYALYPRKKAEQSARRQWNRLKPDPALQVRILAAIAAQTHSEEWQREAGRFVPLFSSWLSGRRWRDECEPTAREIVDWRATRAGIEGMGESLGLGRWNDVDFSLGYETFAAYTKKVEAAKAAQDGSGRGERTQHGSSPCTRSVGPAQALEHVSDPLSRAEPGTPARSALPVRCGPETCARLANSTVVRTVGSCRPSDRRVVDTDAPKNTLVVNAATSSLAKHDWGARCVGQRKSPMTRSEVSGGICRQCSIWPCPLP